MALIEENWIMRNFLIHEKKWTEDIKKYLFIKNIHVVLPLGSETETTGIELKVIKGGVDHVRVS